MTFAALAAGEAVFLDANTFVYHFQPHPVFGPACTDLMERIENQEIQGFTSAHVLSELTHRLLTLEACALFGWPFVGVAQRLKRHPAQVQGLTRFRQAVQEITRYGVRILTIPDALVDSGAAVSQQTGLLTNDALIVAVMRANGLTRLATSDTDFDRVPGITRYAPA